MVRRVVLLVVSLLPVVLGSMMAPPARATVDPSVCDSPTETDTGGGDATIRVYRNQVLLLSAGTFTGDIPTLAEGGTLCVGADAVLDTNYLPCPSGHLVVLGSATLPDFESNPGFELFVAGTATIDRITLRGSATITIATGGTLDGGTIDMPAGAVVENAGTLTSSFHTNGGSTLRNSGDLTARGGLLIDGTLFNTGRITSINGSVWFTLGSSATNSCVIESLSDVKVTSLRGLTNDGIVRAPAGTLWLDGVYRQTSVGVTVAHTLDNYGSILGFGRFQVAGVSLTLDTFAGASPSEPIVVQDLTPPAPPDIFDIQGDTVANVIAGTVPDPGPDELPGGCTHSAGGALADVTIAKTGPATIAPGGRLTYTISARNDGPDTATELVITDTLPPDVTGVDAPGGSPSPGPPPTVTWTLPSLAAGANADFTVSATAPASGELLDRASATSVTADPNPGNNDGSNPAQQVTTTVQAEAPPPNTAPFVSEAAYGTIAGFPVSAGISFYDPDPQQGHSVTLGIPPLYGSVSVSPSGVFTYSPDAGFAGQDSFTAIVCDNGIPALCGEGVMTMLVAPAPLDDAAETSAGVPVRIDVLANDHGNTTTPAVLIHPRSGTVTVQDNAMVYAPLDGFAGTDQFSYTACAVNADFVCGNANVTVLVQAPANLPPVAEDATATTSAYVAVTGAVLASDPDPGQTLSTTPLTPPGSGTAVVSTDGTFAYLPAAGFAGKVMFTVRVCDNGQPAACDDATVTVTVNPVAMPDAAQTTPDTPVKVDVTANDLGAVGAPSVSTPPVSGAATVEPDGRITYLPNSGFTGLDTFRYTICALADAAVCASAGVNVTTGAAPNRQPIVEPLAMATVTDRAVSAPLRYSDPDVGQALTVTLVSPPPAHGGVQLATDGVVTYQPAPDFAGLDQFAVNVCDNASPSLCTHSTVPVTISPLAVPDAAVLATNAAVEIPVAANDRGQVGPPAITIPPASGTAEVIPEKTQSVSYVPHTGFIGSDRFTYQICATAAPSVCAPAQVRLTVRPAATQDAASTQAGQPVEVPVLTNDFAGAAPTVTVLTNPRRGNANVGPGASITYTPGGPSTGVDTFSYRVCTPAGKPYCASAMVTISVVPALVNDNVMTHEDEQITVPAVSNDFGISTRPVVITPPANGTVTGGGTELLIALYGGDLSVLGTPTPLVYIPNPGFVGVDAFTYSRCALNDPTVCGLAEVTVVVLAQEQPPGTTTPPPTTTPPATTPPQTNVSPTNPAPPPGQTSGQSTPVSGLAFTGVGLALLGAAALIILFGAGIRFLARRRKARGTGN